MGFASPISGVLNKVTQGWGIPRPHRDGTHEGFDFPVPIGTPVRAVDDGVVLTSADTDDPGGAGKMISIQHPNKIISRYLHLGERLVAKGTKVAKGQLIAKSGASGIQNSAAHLHFDLKVKPVDLHDVWRWGVPAGGFPAERFGMIGIPAEPFIPTSYNTLVKSNATRFGIPLYATGSMGAIALVGIGVGGYFLWKNYA